MEKTFVLKTNQFLMIKVEICWFGTLFEIRAPTFRLVVGPPLTANSLLRTCQSPPLCHWALDLFFL